MYGIGNIGQTKGTDYRDKRILGKIVDNEDPEQYGRVRIECKEVYGDCPKEDLPWAIPEIPNLIGNTATAGSFGVPVLDSIVYFTLQDGDPSFPVWVGMPVTPQTKKALAATNYPHRYGIIDEKGNYFWVDRETNHSEFHHMSGTQVHIDANGRITITAVENEIVNVTGDSTFNVGGNWKGTVSGNMEVTAGGTGLYKSSGLMTIQGSNVIIIGGTITHQGNVVGTGTAVYTGNVTGQGTSLHTHTHGGVDTGGGNTAPPN